MGKLYIPSQVLTPLDRVREALNEAEQVLANLRGAGRQALHLLHLFDRIAHDVEELDLEGVDVRVERGRFQTIQGRLRQCRRTFLDEVSDVLGPARQQIGPEDSHWWWYLDEAVAGQRRRMLLQIGFVTTAVIMLLTAAGLAYHRFLAPPPSVSQAFRRIENGRNLITKGDFGAALDDFQLAADLIPEDPEPWLWQGVLYDELHEPDRAEGAFGVARSLYDAAFDFYLSRGQVYLEAGHVELAEIDIDRAIAENPDSGWSYYLRSGVDVQKGDYNRALVDLDRAADLAQEARDAQLQALARAQRAQVMRMAPLLKPTP